MLNKITHVKVFQIDMTRVRFHTKLMLVWKRLAISLLQSTSYLLIYRGSCGSQKGF